MKLGCSQFFKPQPLAMDFNNVRTNGSWTNANIMSLSLAAAAAFFLNGLTSHPKESFFSGLVIAAMAYDAIYEYAFNNLSSIQYTRR